MSERKELLSISYHSDDDTGMHCVGEIDFGVNARFQSYIEHYGYDGVKEILASLGHLAWEVKNTFYEIQNKTARQDCSVAKQDCAQQLKAEIRSLAESIENGEKGMGSITKGAIAYRLRELSAV